ncbi:MAG: 50S ribosomal protein L5 [Candidatus Magasanikbacteria bacterium GW2011_GWC2_34_16]|uniref:Large ribosomal subunit protein uL5 n=2 Tax=Candidatus Magasanikiibacteriota TaxID=1752731 RepID=A0A0G0H7R2_9BACT|nr:MAG: 50S ribosomal protein L5 [Candidatus Magasanikbacteria bacterium GW2011_GWC2_34_16]KKQ39293.1 MAG: 50S ribosomal protein L5 [Candidatus Magasanikbacteria bacterium GW2011_GWA2_37_8]
MTNLYKFYKEDVVPKLKADLGYKNIMQVPKVSKVVLNAGIGRFIKDASYIENVERTLANISGQKPIRTKAKKAISNFKIREGLEIGVCVTLRGAQMYEFLEKLIKITFPRTRDFHGVSDKSFDKNGNYTIGFKENSPFPEVKSAEIEKLHGLQIIVNTTAKNATEGKLLLTYLGFPFEKNK